MPNDDEIKAYVNEKQDGSIEYVDGPYRLLDLQVWEVWTYDDDEEEHTTRFVIYRTNATKEYFPDFRRYTEFLTDEYHRRLGAVIPPTQLPLPPSVLAEGVSVSFLEAEERRHKRKLEALKFIVSALVFIAAAGVLLYMVVAKVEPNLVSFGALVSLLSSGGLLFFGISKDSQSVDADSSSAPPATP